MDALEHAGVWWDPATPHDQWVGNLQVDPSEGATLVVTLPLERPNPLRRLRATRGRGLHQDDARELDEVSRFEAIKAAEGGSHGSSDRASDSARSFISA